jgi:hypothetical protein
VECCWHQQVTTMGAAEDDVQALPKRVWKLACKGESVNLKALLGEHPEVDVDGCKGIYGV